MMAAFILRHPELIYIAEYIAIMMVLAVIV